jgi:methionyl-tRNA formyltransferase
MPNYILLSEKEWHKILFENLRKENSTSNWVLIDSVEDFNIKNLEEIKPDKIFIPHWSRIIPSSIFLNFECIVFHMTDLPYGRGGSPLQNLIIRGHKVTKLSAIKVDEGIDTGGVYLKRSLSLTGTAKEIFMSAIPIIENMILNIINNNLTHAPQLGEAIIFKRRKPQDSNFIDIDNLNDLYDFIRMLDCEGYPHAFIETNSIKIEFTNAKLNSNNLTADVRIFKK